MATLRQTRCRNEDPIERVVVHHRRAQEEGDCSLGGGCHCVEIRADEGVEAVQERAFERVLRCVVVEQAALRDARDTGGGIHGRCAFALVDQKAFEGIEDALSGVRRSGHVCYYTGWTV